jgi:hypothetical protein
VHRQLTAAGVFVLAVLFSVGAAAAPRAAAVAITFTPAPTAPLTLGSALVVTIQSQNTTAGTLSFHDNVVLIYPDGTRLPLKPLASPTSSVAAGNTANYSLDSIATTVFTSQTGQFGLEADAIDSTGATIGSATLPFTIQPLPASLVPPRFVDIAPAAGVALVHHSDKNDCINQIGTGAGWADYNDDGRVDLFVTDFNGASHLYRNNGNLTFTDVTASAFPGSVSNGSLNLPNATGVTWADYDDDGHPDLLVMATGHPYLFHDNGDGTFTDVTTAAGLSSPTYLGESAAWGDYDKDGYLDLYLVYYSQNCRLTPISSSPRAPDHLFHNNGDGTFTETTSLLGGTSNPALTGFGFQASWFDENGDGWPDLYVVNDAGRPVHRNVLWQNNGGTFTDVSASTRTDYGISSMGLGIGDYNRDGRFDFAVSNIYDNVLAQNRPNGVFANVARTEGVARSVVLSNGSVGRSVTWGLDFRDLNNDGYEDLMIAGGRLKPNESIPGALFVNNLGAHLTGDAGDTTFLDLTYASGLSTTTGRTLAFADVDRDGWMDVFEENYFDEPSQLYRNVSSSNGNSNRWLEVRLVGAGPGPLGSLPHGSNRDGVGARLTLTAGSDVQYRQLVDGSSLGAGNELVVHFGLAGHTSGDSLTIQWPSGYTQTFTNVAANQRVVATEGRSTLATSP